MPPFMNGMNIPAGDQLLKECLRCSPLNLEMPLNYFDWHEFIQLCKGFLKENFYQFIVFLAGGLSAFHYQRVLDIVGRYPCASKSNYNFSQSNYNLSQSVLMLHRQLIFPENGDKVGS